MHDPFDKRTPYLVTKGGKTDLVIQKFLDDRAEVCAIRHQFANKYGAKKYFAHEHRVYALVLPEGTPTPEGWRISKGYDAPEGSVAIVPDKRTALGKSIDADIKKLPQVPDLADLGLRLGAPERVYCEDGYARTVGLTCFGAINEFVLSVPNVTERSSPNTPFVPADCTQLKHSEFYALKERNEEAEKTINTTST